MTSRGRLRSRAAEVRYRRRMLFESLEIRRLLTYGPAALVSVNNSGAAAGDGSSYLSEQTLTADGRYLVFQSDAADLVASDANSATDVFVRDLQTGTVTLVSRAPAGATANARSTEPAISADGQFVVFASWASNLDVVGLNSSNGQQQVYRWQRATGEIELVSRDSSGLDGGNQNSDSPSINGDGSRIAFATYATNLQVGVSDGNNSADVFLWDSASHVATLVSHSALSNSQASGGGSYAPQMSRDGSRVVYRSASKDLQAGVSDIAAEDLVAFDVSTGMNQYVSLQSTTASTANTKSDRSRFSLSSDGVYEVFSSFASDLVNGDYNAREDVFLRNLNTGQITLVSRGGGAGIANGSSSAAVISSDGAFVAFLSTATDLDVTGVNSTNTYSQAYRWERATGKLVLLSRNAAGTDGSDVGVQNLTISQDGARIAFESYSRDLVSGFIDNSRPEAYYYASDVFLRDVATDSTILVSHASGVETTTGNNRSFDARISRDGSRVVYRTEATDLQASVYDNNTSIDLVVFTVAAGLNEYLTIQTDAAATANAGSTRTEQSLSADGRYEVFSSYASDFIAGDDNGFEDIFLRDLATGTLTLVSRGALDGPANSHSNTAVISDDGAYVAFLSSATNLDVTGTNSTGGRQAFRWRRSDGLLELVSLNAAGSSGANNYVTSLSISGTGSRIVFNTSATDLVNPFNDANGDYSYYDNDLYIRDMAVGTTTLVNHAHDSASTTGNGVAGLAKISRDGSRIVYQSHATDLEAGTSDHNDAQDIIVYTVATNSNAYVTVETSASSTANIGTEFLMAANLNSQVMSADGRFLVFASSASDVLGSDSNSGRDVFLRDMQTGMVTLISRMTSNMSYSDSIEPVISADGNYVSFSSNAEALDVSGVNVSPANYSGYYQVYRWSRATGTLALVSVNSTSTDAAMGNSRHPSISFDGSRISFETDALDVVSDITDTNYDVDIYVRDFATNTSTLVSQSSSVATTTGTGGSYRAKISRDGSTIVFQSDADDLVAGVADTNNAADLFAFDIGTATNLAVSVAASGTEMSNSGVYADSYQDNRYVSLFDISDNGQQIAFASLSTDLHANASAGNSQIYVRDTALSATDLVSVDDTGEAGDSYSYHPSLSGSGRYVTFQSQATNLTALGVSSGMDVFLFDRDASVRATHLISVNAEGSEGGDGGSYNPRISRDGSTVAFETYATNVDSGSAPQVTAASDANSASDVVVRRWQGANPSTQWISKNSSDPSQSANDSSGNVHISENGAVVLYASHATDLDASVADVNGRQADLFLYDGIFNSTVSTKGSGRFTSNGSYWDAFDLSETGQFIAYTSQAVGLVPDTEADYWSLSAQVYVRDVIAQSTQRVSIDMDSTYADDAAYTPSISGDGQRIAFVSGASNLSDFPSGSPQIYLRDLALATTTLVSLNSTGDAAGDNYSESPRMSFDGSHIAFVSYSSDLDATATIGSYGQNVFLWTNGSTTLVSKPDGETESANMGSFSPEISDAGAVVVFDSNATNLSSTIVDINGSTADIFAYDGTSVGPVSYKSLGVFTASSGVNSSRYDMSNSGQLIAFVSNAVGLLADTGDPYSSQVYLRDLSAGLQRISSDDDSALGDGDSSEPSISGDGRYVAFSSNASNFGTQKNNSYYQSDIFVRDRFASAPRIISVNASDTGGSNAHSAQPVISNDGLSIIFASAATDLDATIIDDRNQTYDLFIRNWLATTPETKLVTRRGETPTIASNRGVSMVGGDGRESFELSDDGSRTVFVSSSSDLAIGIADVNGNAQDIFIFDGTTVAAVTLKSSDVFTSGIDSGSQFSISDSAAQIAYTSSAVGVVADIDWAGSSQVYVRDVLTSQTERVSTPGRIVPSGFSFTDNFDNGPSTPWGNEVGKWTATSGTYAASAPNNSPATYSSLPFQLRDFTLDIDINQVADGGIWLRSTNNQHGVLLVTKDDGLYWHIVQDGYYSEALNAASGLFTAGSNPHLKIVVSGDTYSVFVNGQATASTSLSTGAYSSGRLALYSNSGQAFDNVELVATSASTTPNAGNGASFTPSISGDGRFVVYGSRAQNLSPLPTSSSYYYYYSGGDIFAFDRVAGATSLISINSDGTAGASGPSYYYYGSTSPSISRDGATIAFTSAGVDLDPSSTAAGDLYQVYVRNWLAASPTTQLVSRSAGTNGESGWSSEQIRLSDSGTTVAFQSQASDLTTIADTNNTYDVFAVRGIGLVVNSIAIVEGNSGTKNAVFSVELLAPSDQPVTVDFTTMDGTATAGSDYVAKSGTLTFAPSETLKTVSVIVTGDVDSEDDETFLLKLSNATAGIDIFNAVGQATIINDDAQISIADASIIEGNSGTQSLEFVVMLSVPSSLSISVDFATSDLSATLGSDYIAATGTLVFVPGETSKAILVDVVGDLVPEPHELFRVSLSNPINAVIQDGVADGTIFNDDTSLSISDREITEGNAGSQLTSLTVSLSHSSAIPVSVDLATGLGTATEGVDYTIVGPSTVTFSPGEISQSFQISVIGDTTIEPDETVLVNLLNPVAATISDGLGVLTILDDDILISIDDVSVIEGNSGTKIVDFSVSLSGPAATTVTVQVQSSNGTATSGTDYAVLGLTTLTFSPGETTKTVSVTIFGDTLVESDEVFYVLLSNPSNGIIADSQGVGTILNDDTGIQIDDVSVVEGNAGTTNATFTISLTQASSVPVTVQAVTLDNSATAPSDYTAVPSTTFTFAPGETTKSLTVSVQGDTTPEAHEQFFVELLNPTAASIIDSRGVGTILNDDASISISDASGWEGNSETTDLSFAITLAFPVVFDVSVDYAIANGSATAGQDYVASSGTANIIAGSTLTWITVTHSGDTVIEPNETYFVNLTNVNIGVIADAQGVGTILDDDTTVDLSVTGLAIAPESVLRSGGTVVVKWIDANSGTTTTSGVWYDRVEVINTSTQQTLISEYVLYDPAVAGNGNIAAGGSKARQFTFTLPNGSAGAGQLLISVTTDASQLIRESNVGGTGEANNTATTTATSVLAAYPDLIVASITAPATVVAGETIPVAWIVENQGTATASGTWTDHLYLSTDLAIGDDLYLGSFPFTGSIGSGSTLERQAQIVVPAFISGNTRVVVRTNANAGVFETNTNNNSALDDQAMNIATSLQLVFSQTSMAENSSAATTKATLSRNGSTVSSLTVNIAVNDPSSLAIPATVTIPANQSSVQFAINSLDNDVVDGDRNLTVTASSAGFGSGQASIMIIDDEVSALKLTISTATFAENVVNPAATATLTRNTNPAAAMDVQLLSDNPRVSVPTIVTFPAGQSSIAFPVNAVNNNVVDGTSTVTIAASKPGFATGSAQVQVTDDESVQLSISAPTNKIIEGVPSPAVIATVTRNAVTDAAVTVELTSSNPGAISVPASVVIPANQASASFIMNAPDNSLVEGTKEAIVTARVVTSSGVVLDTGAATKNMFVSDDDGATLTLTMSSASLAEGSTTTGTVTRNTPTTAPLIVSLTSLDTSEIIVPTSVTIAAGQTSADFTIQAVSDGISDGTQTVLISAAADGFNSGSASILVSDVDLPDLHVTAFTTPATALTGSNINVSWTVANQGAVSTSGSWTDRIFLSSDNQLGDDILIGSANFSGTLLVNGSYNRNLSLALPNTAGTFYVLVETDAANSIDEGSETNNVRASQALEIQPTYRAVVETPLTVAPAGTSVPLAGNAFDPITSAAVPNQPVTIRILVQGTRREIRVVTDASGNFATTFQPLPGEAGLYSIAADHPGVKADTIQDQFTLIGMRAAPSSATLRVVPGIPLNGTVTLNNLSDLPLTGLTANVLNAPANIQVVVTSPTTLAGSAASELSYTILASDASVLEGKPTIRITSAEGATLDIPLAITVVPLQAQLVANPGTLARGMLRGAQTIVSFEVTNLGGAPSEALSVELPNVSWMSLVSAKTIQPIAPGQKITVTLALNPAANQPLGLYEGSLVLSGANSSLSQSFSLRAISDAVGDVRINVEDEFTYFAEGRPLLAGATVVLMDPFDNSVVIAQGVTDASGTVILTDVPEGEYLLEVRAEKHATYRSSFVVLPGMINAADIFIQRQTVSYNWSVTPTEIEDKYQVTLETTFETNVPAPVVELKLPSVVRPLDIGETIQIEAVLTNHGLIAADNVELSVRPPDGYIVTPLMTHLGTLPAKSELRVPVLITRVATPLDSLRAVEGLDIPCLPFSNLGLMIDAAYTYICDIPIGAIVSAMVLFQEAMGLLITNVEGLVSFAGGCVGEIIASAIPQDKKGHAGNSSSTFSGQGQGGSGFGCGRSALEAGSSWPEYDAILADGMEFRAEAGAENGVCAQVRIRIDQQAVLTRSAFSGDLDILNGHQVGNLEGVQLTLDFRDELGNSASDKFTIVGPELSGVTAVDGTGTILAASSGKVHYTFIPNRDAAPTAAKRYTIGGTLRYIDPSDGLEIVVPLLGATINVLPDPRLTLKYFQQRDVYSDDPHTDEVEPSEPFSLGLLVTNTGYGVAKGFSITSAQPKIIENEKGLLIDFKIIGTQVDTQQVSPSLTAKLGNIEPSQTAVAQWIMTSTLQGKFIDYKASFEHSDALGGLKTSLIESVEIHELIHTVRVDNPTDDGKPDFLVNDLPDPDSLPDTLYLSDGTTAVVNVATNVTADHPASLGQFQVLVSANMTSGWNYFNMPDPGAGYRLQSVTRSDGTILRVEDNVWQTDRTFPSALSGAVREHKLHLLDFNGTGSYALKYVLDDSIAPQLLDIIDVLPDPRSEPVSTVDVLFSEPIDLASFDYHDLSLTRNGGANLITSTVSIASLGDSLYRISGLDALTAADGVYELTVTGAGVMDYGGNPASGTATDRWAKGVSGPFVSSFASLPSHRNTALASAQVTFSKPVDLSTLDYHDISITRDGGANLVTSSVSVELISDSTYRINGLSSLTDNEGSYTLTVSAANIQDLSGIVGVGANSTSWKMDSTSPSIVSIEQLATNPRNIVVQTLDVTFSEAIDLATFDRNDLQLTRDGGDNLIDGRVTVEYVSGNVYRIKGFNWVIGNSGSYQLSVLGSGISDAAGNAGTATVSTTWVMDTLAPAAPTAILVTPDNGVSSTDRLINTLTPTISGTLSEAGLTVRLVDLTTSIDLGYADVVGMQFSKTLTLQGAGAHRIQVRVVDQAGNVNRESRLLEPGGYVDIVVDISLPAVTRISPITPNPRTISLASIDVDFSESIDLATFDWHDIALRRDGGSNLVTSGVTVEQVAGTSASYRIQGLGPLTTANGTYTLSLDSAGVADAAGNLGIGSSSVSWLMDSTNAFLKGSIRGRIFDDQTANGKLDRDDQALAGWTVFLDSNSNNQFDSGIDPSTVSAADGSYSFEIIDAGTYRIGAVSTAGWVASLPAAGLGIYSLVLAPSQTLESVDFGYYLPGEIRGQVFHDLNANAQRDPDEPWLSGWVVYLDDNGNGSLDPSELNATTGIDGSYVIPGVRPGSHIVAQVTQAGWQQTSPGGATGLVSAYQASEANPEPSIRSISGLSAVGFGSPRHFMRTNASGAYYRWQDRDLSTPDVIDVYYDFRVEGNYANLITQQEIATAEASLEVWETAAQGRLRFERNTTADRRDIINIGVGDLAAAGGASRPRFTLALGGGTYDEGPQASISSGIVWLDKEEIWDIVVGNGDVSDTFDFATVVAHEVGHALGLGHTNDIPSRDLMDSVYAGELTSASLNDQALIQFLYGRSAGTYLPNADLVSILSTGVPGAHVVRVTSQQIVNGLNFGNELLNQPPELGVSSSAVVGGVLTTLTNSGTWSDPESDSVTLSASLGEIVKHADGTWNWTYAATSALSNQQVTITASDGMSSSTVTFSVSAQVNVSNAQVFYKGSAFTAGGTNVAAALDPSKELAHAGTAPLTLSYVNMINTTLGINGIVFDIAGLTATSLASSDFGFYMSPQGLFNAAANPPSSWAAAPAPSGIFVTPGTDTTAARIRIEWPDNAIANRWLQIRVLKDNTDLPNTEVYYLGHLQGELNGQILGNAYIVSNADLVMVRPLAGGVRPVTDIRDLDKNRVVSNADGVAIRNAIVAGYMLRNITIPVAGSSDEGLSPLNAEFEAVAHQLDMVPTAVMTPTIESGSPIRTADRSGASDFDASQQETVNREISKSSSAVAATAEQAGATDPTRRGSTRDGTTSTKRARLADKCFSEIDSLLDEMQAAIHGLRNQAICAAQVLDYN